MEIIQNTKTMIIEGKKNLIYSFFLWCNFSDPNYVDPLGPQMERPKTAAKRRDLEFDEFADEELGEDLLPE